MKLKQLLAGVLATALVVTGMPVSGLVASADDAGSVGAQHGIENSGYVYHRLTSNPKTWTVSTDAGSGADTDITNILKDDDKWISADAVVSTVAADQQAGHPVKDITLERNNNFYLKLKNPAEVGRLVYYCSTGHKNGKILKANVYVSTDSRDVSTVDELKKLDWGEPVAADSNKQECSGTGFGQTKAVEYKFDEVKQGVKYVRMEALETCGEEWQALPNTLICCFEMELYSDNTTALSGAASKKIAAADMTAYADFGTHKQDNQDVTKILDGAGTTGVFRTDFQNSNVCCSMEANVGAEFNESNYLDYPLQKGFVKNNNIFMTLDEPQNLAMLTYVPADIVGSILDARIYLSNKDGVTDAKEIGTGMQGDATQTKKDDWSEELSKGWVKVYDGEEQWAKWNANPQSNNGHSVYWDPMTAKHVRIEVEHTYNSAATSASLTRNTKINAKRILLYKGVKAVDVSRAQSTKIVAYSGYLSAQDKADHPVEHMFDGTSESHMHDTEWLAGPALKGTGANATDVPYIVLDLGENTRTLVDDVSIMWNESRYATKYVVLTTDDLDPAEDIKEIENPGETDHWSDKVLNNPPKLDGNGRGFANLVYDEKWEKVREGDPTKGGLDTDTFDGASPDNMYFETTKSEEVKRYICLVPFDMNAQANGDGVGIRCAEIKGDTRSVAKITEAKINVVAPVSNAAPVALSRADDMTDFTVVNAAWMNGENQIYPSSSSSTFGDLSSNTYTVKATLKPDSSRIFTKDTKISLVDSLDQTIVYNAQATLNKDDTVDITYTFGACECVISEITGIEDESIAKTSGENITKTLNPQATISGTCPKPGHEGKTVTFSYRITEGGDIAAIEGNTLTITGAGTVKIEVTAEGNGKSVKKTVTYTVTEPASSEAKAELKNLADHALDDLTEDEYTANSWQDLLDAIQDAQDVAEDENASAADVQDAKEALEDAKKNLVKKSGGNPDPTPGESLEEAREKLAKELEAAQAAYEAEAGRTDEAWTNFEAAYLAAKEAVENPQEDATVDSLNKLKEDLSKALSALSGKEPTPDTDLEAAKEGLSKELGAAQAVYEAGVKAGRTDGAWKAFEAAYKAAQNAPADASAEALRKLAATLKETLAAAQKQPDAQQPGAQQPAVSNLPKVGSQHTVGKLVYQVKTSTEADKTVMIVKPVKKTNKKLAIPATVKIGGQSYKVVEIKANAFVKNKKLTAVTIGKNVKKIGKKAFFGCAKLKKVTIKAAGLKTVGKQAFAKINKKAKIKVPKKQLKTLKKKFKKAKTIKSAKITK